MSRKRKAPSRARRTAAAGNSPSLTVGARVRSAHALQVPHARRLGCEQLEDRRLLAVVTVDVLDDSVDLADGRTSLREAIFATNTVSGADEIRFDPALFANGARTILLTRGELAINEPLTIAGPGVDLLTIDAQSQSRVLHITATTGDYLISGVTLARGQTLGDNQFVSGFDYDTIHNGGAIRSASSGVLKIENATIRSSATLGVAAQGGGVFTVGSLRLVNSDVIENHTAGDDASGGGAAAGVDLTIIDGSFKGNHTAGDRAPGGGASSGRDLSVSASEFSGNHTAGDLAFGGGASARRDATFVASTLSGNHTAGEYASGGGATALGRLAFDAGRVTLNSTMGAQAGGGGLFAAGDLTVSGSVISGNRAGGPGAEYSEGGGLLGGEDVTITTSVVSGNQANRGGGVAASSHVSIAESTISGNLARAGRLASGGGVYARRSLSVANSTISGNRAEAVQYAYGGAIRASYGLAVRHSTITDNRALRGGAATKALGGAIFGGGRNTSLTVEHSIIAANSSKGDGPDFRWPSGARSINFSLIGDNRGLEQAEAPVGAPDANGNLIGGPVHGVIDPLLGPLADNGGPTLPGGAKLLTHALLPGSPAIDAGDGALVAGVGGVPEFDQRGAPFSRVVGTRIDMGAVEQTGVPLEVDTLVDESDGDYRRGDVSLREAIELANAQAGADVVEFDPKLFAAGARTILLTHGELAITDSLTITGPGAPLLTIDASGNDPTPDVNNGDGSRVFHIDDGNAATGIEIVITTLHLRGGDIPQLTEAGEAAYGGAVFSFEPLTLEDVTVSESSARHGGGVAVANANLTIRGSLFEDNSANRTGGGVWFSWLGQRTALHSLVIEGSVIRGNQVVLAGGGGGGVYLAYALGSVSTSSIIENSAYQGGGIAAGSFVFLTDLQVIGSVIARNEGELGGGIHGQFRSLVLNGVVVENNHAESLGGGIWHSAINGRLEIIDSKIRGNRGSFGGGVFAKLPNLLIVRSEIRENSAGSAEAWGGRGGGLNIGSDSTSRNFLGVIRDSVIADNTAFGNGGGIAVHDGQLTIERSTISGNQAISRHIGLLYTAGVYQTELSSTTAAITLSFSNVVDNNGHGVEARRPLVVNNSTIARNEGAGILAEYWTQSLTIDSSTISGNAAGGVVLSTPFQSHNVSIRHSTITGNVRVPTTPARAAGIELPRTGNVEITSSIISGNGLTNGAPLDLSRNGTAIPTVHVSLIGFSGISGYPEAPIGSPDANGNLIGGPVHGEIDPLLGPLADNGGPTLTHALLPGSPAIDAGDGALVPGVGGVPEFDQRGAPFTRVAGAAIDIGAVEFQAVGGALTSDFNFDGRTDGHDFLAWQRNVGRTSGATIRHGDATADGDVDGNDLAVWKARFGAEGSGFGVQGSAGEAEGGLGWVALSRDAESAERSAGELDRGAFRASKRFEYVRESWQDADSRLGETRQRLAGFSETGISSFGETRQQIDGEAWDAAWEEFDSAIDSLL